MGFVKLEKQGHVGIVTIDRQEALNALNSQVLSDLDAVIDQVAADEEKPFISPMSAPATKERPAPVRIIT